MIIATLGRLRGAINQPNAIIQKLQKRNICISSISCSSDRSTFSGKSVVELMQDNESKTSSIAKYLSTESLLNLLLEKSKSSSATAIASTNSVDNDDNKSNSSHPKLGSLFADLGYKRVYLTSIEKLAFIPVWERQRTLRPQRSLLIAEEKIRVSSLRGNTTAGITGIISAYMHRTSGDIGILDGQHRIGALAILSEKGWWDLKRENIVLEVFLVDDEEQIVNLFRDINSAEPVRLVDMPDNYSKEEEGEEESVTVFALEVDKIEESAVSGSIIQPIVLEPIVETLTTLSPPLPSTKTAVIETLPVEAQPVEPLLEVGLSSKASAFGNSEEKQTVIIEEVVPSDLPVEKSENPSPSSSSSSASTKKPSKKKASKSSSSSSPSSTPTQPNSSSSSDSVDSAAESNSEIIAKPAKKAKGKKASNLERVNADQLRKNVLDEVALTLQSLHANAFSPSQRCLSPRINIDNIRDDLFQCRYVREMEITDVSNVTELHEQLVDRLYRRIMEVNEQIYAEELARQAEK
eukprot:gene30547-40597_t